MILSVNERELGTILASLRYLTGASIPDMISIATDMGRFEPLSADEVDELCVRINCDLEAFTVPQVENYWRLRADAGNLEGQDLIDAQGHFLAGALAVRKVMGMDNWCPPKWVQAMRGGTPLEPTVLQ